ncbi:hypothetical protein NKI56_35900 [Mesorhizobium sp. M0622]|uniref:hypothetical protein n=1 Tax=Mesorhizobium sp. M0622 TaxID=2956975 RepID=UPI0033392013
MKFEQWYLNVLYEWQTLITGILAVAAAGSADGCFGFRFRIRENSPIFSESKLRKRTVRM